MISNRFFFIHRLLMESQFLGSNWHRPGLIILIMLLTLLSKRFRCLIFNENVTLFALKCILKVPIKKKTSTESLNELNKNELNKFKICHGFNNVHLVIFIQLTFEFRMLWNSCLYYLCICS